MRKKTIFTTLLVSVVSLLSLSACMFFPDYQGNQKKAPLQTGTFISERLMHTNNEKYYYKWDDPPIGKLRENDEIDSFYEYIKITVSEIRKKEYEESDSINVYHYHKKPSKDYYYRIEYEEKTILSDRFYKVDILKYQDDGPQNHNLIRHLVRGNVTLYSETPNNHTRFFFDFKKDTNLNYVIHVVGGNDVSYGYLTKLEE